jgi:hypothetical protein
MSHEIEADRRQLRARDTRRLGIPGSRHGLKRTGGAGKGTDPAAKRVVGRGFADAAVPLRLPGTRLARPLRATAASPGVC